MTLEGRTALSVEICTNRWAPDPDGGLHHVQGAEDVGRGRFDRVVLENRDVLVGGRVEHHIGAEPLEGVDDGQRGR